MKYRLLAGWVLGVGLVASAAAINCGGDDTSSPAAAGSGGTAGSTGTAGETGTGGGTSGQGGGTAGAGVTGGGGQGGGGATGTGGADASTSDAPVSDGAKANLVPFQSVVDILTAQCTGCHKGNDGSVTGLVDLQTATGLYARLTSPLPSGQEGQCGFPDGGTDGGDGGSGANRALIVAGDIANSLLYLKILGTQPAGCGVHMPRIKLTLDDGGTTTVACDQADGGAASNCLSTEQSNTIRDWITQGAHETAPEN